MANNESLKNKLTTKKETGVGSAGNTIRDLLNAPAIKKRFEEVLKDKAPQYMSSIISLVNGDTNLKNCNQMSVVASAMVAATMDLPIDKNLGYAWIVPYDGKAQFQMGYKGYIQLALRTGVYKAINAIPIYEGELISWNKLTEELVVDFEKKVSDKVVGYAGYFELINGFKKTVYWSMDQIIKHKNKFSKSDYGWSKDFDAMALKTVIRNMLSKWGILSIEMQSAFKTDDKVANISKDGEVETEGSNNDYIDAEFTEVITEETDFTDTPFEEK